MSDQECPATGESLDPSLLNDDGTRHTHTCVGRHDGGDHYCGGCQRWWYQTPKNTRRAVPPRKKVK